MDKAKIALVGVSGFGRTHYEDILRAYKAGRVEIICATVINQAEESAICETLRQYGCTVFDDAREMFRWFAGKVDVCFLPVGIGLHAPMSIAAMRAGMNVFLEKPLTATLQEADEIIAVSKETGRFVAVGYQFMYQPQIEDMKRAILSGKLGRLKTVRGIGLWPRGKAYYARNNWAGKLRTEKGWILDSPVNNALAHYLNLVCYLGGCSQDEMVDLETLQAGLYRANPEIESFDTAFLKMQSVQGVDLLFVASHVSQTELPREIEVVGERGVIRWTTKSYSLQTDEGTVTAVAMPSNEQIRNNVMDAVLKRVADAKALVFTSQRARLLTSIVNAAHASAPIIPVASEQVLQVVGDNANDVRYVWKGLDDIAHRCYDEVRMPTTTDFAFCKNGSPTNPAAMTQFDGFQG